MITKAPRTIIYDWSINKNRNRATVIILVLACLWMLLIPWFMSPQLDPFVARIGLGTYTLTWLLIVLGIIAIHEGLHGVFFWLYSRHLSFGVKWKTKFGPAPYATSSGRMFTKRQYQMIGFAPQFLSATLLVFGIVTHDAISALLLMAAAANLAGGCIDIWSIYEIQRLPENILVEDTSDGFKVWSAD